MGTRKAISIFGTDYPTSDGNCIRDYIHVSDLATAHCLGLEFLLREQRSEVFNLGNGQGFSVREVIETAEFVTGQKINVITNPRRPGDPPVLVGSGKKAQQILGWLPRYSDLSEVLTHAWRWHLNQSCSS